jgi:hypothetical protein
MITRVFFSVAVGTACLMMVGCGDTDAACMSNSDCGSGERCNDGGECVPMNGTGGTGGSYSKVAQALVPEVSLRPDPKGDAIGTALPLASDLRAYGNRAESFSPLDVAGLDLAYSCSTEDDSLLVLCGGSTLPSGTLQIAQSQFWAPVRHADAGNCSSYSVAFGDRQYDVRWDASARNWQMAVMNTDSDAPSSLPSAARAVLEGDTLTWLIPSNEVDAKAQVQYSSSVDACGNALPLGRDVVAMYRPDSEGAPSTI